MHTITDEQAKLNAIDALIDTAKKQLASSHHHLNQALHFIEKESTPDEGSSLTQYELILQYRLDTEDLLKSFIHANQAICHALGIEENASFAKNIDIAALMLGKEAANHELSYLHNLCAKLSHVLELERRMEAMRLDEKKRLNRLLKRLKGRSNNDFDAALDDYLDEQDKKTRKARCHKDHRAAMNIEHELHDALSLQAQFAFSVEQLTEAIQAFGNIPKFGLIHDHVAALKGPISSFALALQHGIGINNALKKTLGHHMHLNEKNNEKSLATRLSNQLDKHINLQQQQLKDAKQSEQQLLRLEQQTAPAPKQHPIINEPMATRRMMRWF